MFVQALRVALHIALFKSGPQDMPYSVPLARAAVAMAIASTMLLLAPVTPMPLAFATGAGGVVGVAFFTRQLLRGRKLENRWLQTFTAQLLVGSLFALAMWPAFMAMAPSMLEVMEQMRSGMTAAAEGREAAPLDLQALQINPPAWAALWTDVLFLWSLVVTVRINRLAADLGRPSSWLLTLLSLFVLGGFIVIAQILVGLFV